MTTGMLVDRLPIGNIKRMIHDEIDLDLRSANFRIGIFHSDACGKVK